MNEMLYDKGAHLIPVIAYGDAAGLPFETKHADYIADKAGYVTSLQPLEDNPFYIGYSDVGATSDDTELTEAVAKALIESDSFDLEVIARQHVDLYNSLKSLADGRIVVRAWGGSTTESVGRIATGVSPTESGQENGSGNGIIMKMAPLSFWHAARQSTLDERMVHYDQLTSMTHDSDVARTCTRIHGEMLHSAFSSKHVFNTEEFRRIAKSTLDTHARGADYALIREAIEYPVASFGELVHRYAGDKSGFKYGFYVPETLAIVYDIISASDGDFETAIWMAVNLGGDCDSTASIAGTISLAGWGLPETWPNDFNKTAAYPSRVRTSEHLARSALRYT